MDAEFAKNVDSFTTLSFNRDELESQMPQESPSQPKQLNEHGQALITQLDLLNTLLETRAQLQDKYLEQVTGLDMTNMLLAGNQKFEAVIEQAKSKLEDIDNELKTNVMGQSDILEVIQETFQKVPLLFALLGYQGISLQIPPPFQCNIRSSPIIIK